MTASCLLCGRKDCPSVENPNQDRSEFDCPTCGDYAVVESALAVVARLTQREKWALAHVIRTRRGRDRFILHRGNLEELLARSRLPTPSEQLENFVLLVGDKLSKNRAHSTLEVDDLGSFTAAIGAQDSREGVVYILNEAKLQGLVNWLPRELGLTFAGFELRRLDDPPRAGLLDARLQVEIRRSRFLVADLTEENPGVYWEAGFAHGLGLLVFYTCENTYFSQNRTHFDTEHRYTVAWEADNLAAAADELKAAIRSTLPGEAILEDVDGPNS